MNQPQQQQFSHIHTKNTLKSNQIKSNRCCLFMDLRFFFIFCTKLAIYLKMHIHIHIAYTFASEIRGFPKRFQLRVDGRIQSFWITLETAHLFWSAIFICFHTSTEIHINAQFSSEN